MGGLPPEEKTEMTEMINAQRSLKKGAGGLPPKKKMKRRALQLVTMYIQLRGRLPLKCGGAGFPPEEQHKEQKYFQICSYMA
jgi:hypothetical protein